MQFLGKVWTVLPSGGIDYDFEIPKVCCQAGVFTQCDVPTALLQEVSFFRILFSGLSPLGNSRTHARGSNITKGPKLQHSIA